jgi:urease accessory protein UreE
MISELSIIDKIEVLEDGQIQVRRADKVLRDGVEIAKTYHRHVLAPGDDLTGQDAKVVAVAHAVWAPS